MDLTRAPALQPHRPRARGLPHPREYSGPVRVLAGTEDEGQSKKHRGKRDQAPAGEPAAPEASTHGRIAVVDDDPDIRTLLRMWLELAGYEVVSLPDGESAIEFLESDAPDLLLLDLRLPGIGGEDVLQHVRASKRLRRLPVIVISAHVTENERHSYVERGATAALAKPFSSDQLLGEIGRALR